MACGVGTIRYHGGLGADEEALVDVLGEGEGAGGGTFGRRYPLQIKQTHPSFKKI